MPSSLSGSDFIHFAIVTIPKKNSKFFLSSNFLKLPIPLSTKASCCPVSRCPHGGTKDLGDIQFLSPLHRGKETRGSRSHQGVSSGSEQAMLQLTERRVGK